MDFQTHFQICDDVLKCHTLCKTHKMRANGNAIRFVLWL